MTTQKHNSLSEQLTVLVCSCDAYEDLWAPFFSLLNKYWPDLDCRVVLNTETKHCNDLPLPVEALHPNDPAAPYGQRMSECLSRIDTPYTLLLLDDFFLRAPVDTQKICDIVAWMDTAPNIASVNFDWNNPFTDKEGAVSGYFCMPQYAMYKLNMQAGIWRTDRLRHYWRNEDDPWRWELFVNYLTFTAQDRFYCAESKTVVPLDYGYDVDGMGVFRGKWVIEDVAPLFAANGIYVDYSLRGTYVKEGSRPMMPINARTVRYMLSRIGVRYTAGLLWFTAGKRLRKKLGLPNKYTYYPELLSARAARKREGRREDAV